MVAKITPVLAAAALITLIRNRTKATKGMRKKEAAVEKKKRAAKKAKAAKKNKKK